jgi:hypothetical protein
MSQSKFQKQKVPVKAPEPARIVEALGVPEAPAKPSPSKRVKIANVSFGLVLIDPIDHGVYTHNPTPVTLPSPWVEDALERGILIEV